MLPWLNTEGGGGPACFFFLLMPVVNPEKAEIYLLGAADIHPSAPNSGACNTQRSTVPQYCQSAPPERYTIAWQAPHRALLNARTAMMGSSRQEDGKEAEARLSAAPLLPAPSLHHPQYCLRRGGGGRSLTFLSCLLAFRLLGLGPKIYRRPSEI